MKEKYTCKRLYRIGRLSVWFCYSNILVRLIGRQNQTLCISSKERDQFKMIFLKSAYNEGMGDLDLQEEFKVGSVLSNFQHHFQAQWCLTRRDRDCNRYWHAQWCLITSNLFGNMTQNITHAHTHSLSLTHTHTPTHAHTHTHILTHIHTRIAHIYKCVCVRVCVCMYYPMKSYN